MVDDARSEALAALSRFLVAGTSLGATLERVATITTEALPAAEMAGISMLDEHGRPTTAVFTDPRSPEIDTAQYGSGEGPCLDAWRTKRTVRLDDLAEAEDRYPEFARSAQRYGIHSTLSLPLVAGDQGLGALNLYARRQRGFTTADEELGLELAATAAAVLANSSAYWGALELTEQLTEAIRSRAVIEQAKGLLMAASPGLTPDEAFRLLARVSQRENLKLREIAQRLVDRRTLHTDHAAGPADASPPPA